MCPLCLSTVALIACGVLSTGGVAAIAFKKFGGKNASNEANDKEIHHGDDDSSQYRNA